MGVAFFASHITMERHLYKDYNDFTQNLEIGDISYVYFEKHKPIDFSVSIPTVSHLGFSDIYYDIYRIQMTPFVVCFDADCDISCENFIISSIFEMTDTMHERHPGHTGFYHPIVSPESLNIMIDSISEALSHPGSIDELRTLIDSFHEHHWNTYPIIFFPFLSSSADIISIVNFNDGTVMYSRDEESH